MVKMKTIRKGKVPPAILLLSIKLLLRSNIAVGSFPLLIVLNQSVPESVEGRVEHQKLNQVAALLLLG